MGGYTKLFGSIVFSTIWREDLHVKVVWVTMLALADQYGEVMASIPGLADAARVTIEQCEDSIRLLQQEDRHSRTPDFGGRRIEKIQGGWLLLNYAKYRDESSREHTLRKNAERQRRYRERVNANNPSLTVTIPSPVTLSVTVNNPKAEAEAEAEETKKKNTPPPKKKVVKEKVVESLETILGGKGSSSWESYWKLVGVFGPTKNPAPKTTARLYIQAIGSVGPDEIHAKAVYLAKGTSEAKYLPQLSKWLEGEGYLNPNTSPTGGQSATRTNHRSRVDTAYLLSIQEREPNECPPGAGCDMFDLFDSPGQETLRP